MFIDFVIVYYRFSAQAAMFLRVCKETLLNCAYILRYVCLYQQIYELLKNFNGVLYWEFLLSSVDISNFTQNLTAMGTLHGDSNAFFHASHE